MERNLEPLIRKLIDNFSLETFSEFLLRKNPDFLVYEPSDVPIPEKFEDRFSEVYKVGELKLKDGRELVVFGIKTEGELTERSSKKAQFELGKYLLNSEYKDCGIFVFYDNIGNFRFSFIYKTYHGTKAEFSYYKRYTYYVEKGKPYRTFLKALLDVSFDTLESILRAFQTQPLTKEFYTEIQNWFAWALKEAKFPGGILEENLIRLLTRLIFVWFLKEKKLIPEEIFDEEFLKGVVKDFGKADYYYNAILQNLFFATLNRYPHERRFATQEDFLKNGEDVDVKSLYIYRDKILISEEEFIRLFEKVPFINGGLFECLDEGENYIDGFSIEDEHRAKLPDYLFFSPEREEDLSHFYGKKRKVKVRGKVRGLINILKDYNFTADESSPVDVEVSLDPELLGHIFENLLASYNPETQTTARKATGSYYTPKEIVDFMVEESLVEYFKTATKLPEETIRSLLSYSEEEVSLKEEEKRELIKAIDNLKVLDPAVGSGAFPVGVLHKLVHVLSKIDPDNKLWREFQREKALQEIEKVLEIEDKEKREELLKDVDDAFDESIKYPDYARKLYVIENSLYGVDIQPIAIQICKLRFFLSLLIDQKVDFSKENFGIRPLPHLETRFVSADFLKKLRKGGNYSLQPVKIQKKKEELKRLYKRYLFVKNRAEKKRIENEVKAIKEELREDLKSSGWPNEEIEKILSFDIFSQTATADWFDPEWMFGIYDGFDVVIGNPPYIQLQKAYNKEGLHYADLYKDEGYETFDGKGDVYALFYERGIEVLKPNGILCFITSNKWMRAGYGEKLRKFFTKYNPKLLIDLGPDVFESSRVDTCIVLIQKAKNENTLKGVEVKEKDKSEIDLRKLVKERAVELKDLGSGPWFIGGEAERKLKEKIEKIGKPLKEWDVKIYYGIKTGLNEAFIITTEKREEILRNCRTEEERRRTEAIIKPVLRGRDIKRYYYEWAGLWLIFIPWHFPLHEDSTIQGASKEAEREFQRQYPAIYEHLLQFKEALSKRNKKETGIRYEWYALQRCAATYYPEFEKEKVVWQEIVREPQFHYDTEKFYIEATGFIMTGKHLKYLCGLLNSYPVAFIFKKWYAGGGLGEEGYRYKKAFMEKLPLPPITPSNQSLVSQIENLVDEIIKAKKQDKNADTTQWEREIDELVYKLYDLTEDEIKIIEEQT